MVGVCLSLGQSTGAQRTPSVWEQVKQRLLHWRWAPQMVGAADVFESFIGKCRHCELEEMTTVEE